MKATVCMPLFFVLLLSIQLLPAQPNTPAESQSRHHAFLITLGPIGILNTESKTKSAPSPVIFSLGAGLKIPDDTKIAFEPRLSFFTSYYLWEGNSALPAEVENRTAMVFSFLLDLPAVATFQSGQHEFEIGTGVAILARYGILASGVSASDTGTTGTASGDVDKINDWFWSDTRFLYPELISAWNYHINEHLQAGLEQRIYIPVGSLMNGQGLNALMYTIAARLMFL